MASDEQKPGDPFHSGHTVMLDAEGKPATPDAGPGAAPQQPQGGKLNPAGWGAKTMALPAEAFDGLEGLPTPGGGGHPGPPGGGAGQSGKTMALPTPPGPGPGGGAPQGGYGGQGGAPGGYGGAPGGQGGAPGGYGGAPGGYGSDPTGGSGGAARGASIPYLETQAIQAPTGNEYPGAPQFSPPPQQPPHQPSYGGDEPVKTTLLDPSKIDLSSLGGPAPPPSGPPPMQSAPGTFDSDGMAQGQKTVLLRPEAAMQALEQHGPAGGGYAAPAPQAQVPSHLQGRLVIFVPDTEPIVFELMPGITTVGRGMENHLVLGDPYASRKHMVITNRSGQYEFEDTGSDNGTQVNDDRCRQKMLVTGDVIEIGNVMMRFVLGDIAHEHQVRPSPAPVRSKRSSKRRVKKKKKNQAQIIMLMVLVFATVGLIVMMVLLYLDRQG